MNASDFRPVGRVRINGVTKTLYEHTRLNLWRWGKLNIRAKTKEEAIAKYVEIGEQIHKSE